MDDIQKTKIENLRACGFGYKRIAKETGISESTVKSYCRRHQVMKKEVLVQGHHCLQCGKLVEQNAKRKEKKFCCDVCRMAWWNSHLELVKRKAVYEHECHYCHKHFVVYSKVQRKYCSHQCYINERFGEYHAEE